MNTGNATPKTDSAESLSTEGLGLSQLHLTLAAAISGLNGVDALLAEAGYKEDSSSRNQLSCIRSMLAKQRQDSRAKCPHCGGTPGLTGGLMCCEEDW